MVCTTRTAPSSRRSCSAAGWRSWRSPQPSRPPWRRVALAAAPPGPEWLALPLPPERVARHLDGEAQWPAVAAFIPAIAAIAAGAGLVPAAALPVLAIAFTSAWWLATTAAVAIASRVGVPRAGARPLPPATRAWWR